MLTPRYIDGEHEQTNHASNRSKERNNEHFLIHTLSYETIKTIMHYRKKT